MNVSFSGSKLPGYILPSIPPLTILTADYLNRIRREGLPKWLLWAHAALCALMVFVLVLAPQHMKYETLVPSVQWLIIAAVAALFFGAVVLLIVRRWGISQMCNATLIPVLAGLVFLLGFYGKELDINYSARPLAREIQHDAPNVKLVATNSIKRDMDYGLAFYRNQPMIHYETDGVPDAEHLRLGAGGPELLALAEIGGEGHHLAAIGQLQPFQDDRGGEPAGIGEHDLLDVAHGSSREVRPEIGRREYRDRRRSDKRRKAASQAAGRSLRLALTLSLFSWPQAAMMSWPRGVRTGEA